MIPLDKGKSLLIPVLGSLILLMIGVKAMAKHITYSVTARQDGGYTLAIDVSKRHWMPITAEGFFPKEEISYQIEIVGQGDNWSYRNQNGYYYSLNEISCNNNNWDLGYVWVDSKRENLYINLYWVSEPDKLVETHINGKYVLKQ
jgi:hypothetical protein